MFQATIMKTLAVLAIINAAVAASVEVTKEVKDCQYKAKNGDSVSVHYTGKLTDGSVFDSSLNRGVPITFELGAGRVIQGWEDGLLGMCIGEKRTLTIPSELGYGKRGVGPIPPNASLGMYILGLQILVFGSVYAGDYGGVNFSSIFHFPFSNISYFQFFQFFIVSLSSVHWV
ncbi:hypothetical protein JCM33374_g1007 [Metschnikowia sp. JCM 33374]|nr:hypothetical protein JCM33374_g1007 [Metschnikowia sp. JCM 33374]